MQADPESEEFLSLKTELEELIQILEGNLAQLKPSTAQKDSSPPKEKWSKENHPAYQAGYRKPEEEKVVFSVNDNVLAKWKSGDKGMHPAKIISITGSSSKPIYVVRFKAGGDTETVFTQDLKLLSYENKKRKADGTPVASPTSVIPPNPNIISAAANIDTALASQVKNEANGLVNGPPKPTKIARKVKANKELEAGKNKWQAFAKGNIGKTTKKESMFRTGDSVNARGMLIFSLDASILTWGSWLCWIWTRHAQRSISETAHLPIWWR